MRFVALERLNLKWLIAKEFSNGNLVAHGHIAKYGKLEQTKFWTATKQFIREVWTQSSSGILFFLWGIIILPFSKRSIRYIVKGIKKLCWVAGVLTGLAKFKFNLYRDPKGN